LGDKNKRVINEDWGKTVCKLSNGPESYRGSRGKGVLRSVKKGGHSFLRRN